MISWKRPMTAAAFAAATLLAAPSAEAAKTYKPTEESKFYIACYIFTSGNNQATAFPPVKANGAEMFNYFEGNLGRALLPLFPQHHNIRCVADDTPELASKARLEHGYALAEQPWPKGLPDAARPVYLDGKGYVPKGTVLDEEFYVACYAFQPDAFKPRATPSTYLPVVRATGAEIFDDLTGKLQRSLSRSQPPGSHVTCRTGDTPEAAAEGRAWNFVKAADAPWPADVRLASLGKGAPPPKKTATAPKPPPKAAPAQTGYLTVKADPSIAESKKRMDDIREQTAKADADRQAKIAALKAKDDSEFKAKMDAFWAERRRQGNKQ